MRDFDPTSPEALKMERENSAHVAMLQNTYECGVCGARNHNGQRCQYCGEMVEKQEDFE